MIEIAIFPRLPTGGTWARTPWRQWAQLAFRSQVLVSLPRKKNQGPLARGLGLGEGAWTILARVRICSKRMTGRGLPEGGPRATPRTTWASKSVAMVTDNPLNTIRLHGSILSEVNKHRRRKVLHSKMLTTKCRRLIGFKNHIWQLLEQFDPGKSHRCAARNRTFT